MPAAARKHHAPTPSLLDLIGSLRSIPHGISLVAAALLVGFLGLTDHLTGSELSFSIFYLIPISLVALCCGSFPALIISAFSALVWLVADLTGGHQYSRLLIPFWNAAVRLGYFSIHTVLLSALLDVIEREKGIARIDPLTGIANYRCLEEYARRELEHARRIKKPLTIAYVDLDNFKAVNDSLGHDAGDELLRTTAEIMQGGIRACDMAARIGGDEFALLLTDSDYEGANATLERIRRELLSEMRTNGSPVTFSIGAVTFRALPPSVEAMVKRADELMYSVKQAGKDRLEHECWPKN